MSVRLFATELAMAQLHSATLGEVLSPSGGSVLSATATLADRVAERRSSLRTATRQLLVRFALPP